MLHLPGPIELLLQDGGPAGNRGWVTGGWPLTYSDMIRHHGHHSCLLRYAVEANSKEVYTDGTVSEVAPKYSEES